MQKAPQISIRFYASHVYPIGRAMYRAHFTKVVLRIIVVVYTLQCTTISFNDNFSIYTDTQHAQCKDILFLV